MKSSLLFWANRVENSREGLDGKNASLASQGKADFSDRSIHPAAGEVVGWRLMQLLGIGTSPCTEIVEGEEAIRRDGSQWVRKTMIGSRVRSQPWGSTIGRPARWVILSQKIPRAITVHYLRKFYGIDRGQSPVSFLNREEVVASDNSNPFSRFVTRLWLGKDSLPNAQEFYADFSPPADWSAVRQAIEWDSNQVLAIHAARLFLCTTAAHTSNLLVDPEGGLYTIDFEYCARTAGEELDKLFANVVPGTRAFESLRPISKVREREVAELFEELPEWIEWPLGSKEQTVEHYTERLRKWKRLFEARSKN